MPSTQKPIFLAFEASYDDDAYGEDLPVAVVIRLDQAEFTRLSAMASTVQPGGGVHNACAALAPDAFRWIKQVGITPECVLASVEGFFDASTDVVMVTQGVLDKEVDAADFMDACVVYPGQMVKPGIVLELLDGEVMVTAQGIADLGQRRQFGFGGVFCPWSKVADVAEQAWREHPVVDSPAQEAGALGLTLDATDKATILAALTHYMQEGQGEPNNRSDHIHALATGPEDSLVSMDGESLAELIGRVQAFEPVELAIQDGEASGIFETEVVVRVLSEGALSVRSLAQIADAISMGDCVGVVDIGPSVALPREKAIERTHAMGSDPNFFADQLVDDDTGEAVRPDRPTA